MKIRKLKAHEIECRIATVKDKGLSIYLYRDAVCDMSILDDSFGQMGWQRRHYEIKGNIYCEVSIWDEEKKQWIYKSDCGTGGQSEENEKAESSDSFKRACVNWGIGRELKTAPFIWVKATNANIVTNKSNKLACYDLFIVKYVAYDENGSICELKIHNETINKQVYYFKANNNLNDGQNPNKPKQDTNPNVAPITTINQEKKATNEQIATLIETAEIAGADATKLLTHYKINSFSEMTEIQFQKSYQSYLKHIENDGREAVSG